MASLIKKNLSYKNTWEHNTRCSYDLSGDFVADPHKAESSCAHYSELVVTMARTALVQEHDSRVAAVSNLQLERLIMMPVFDGYNPFGWNTRAEIFFSKGKYTTDEKLAMVPRSLRGEALDCDKYKKAYVRKKGKKLTGEEEEALYSKKEGKRVWADVEETLE